MGIFDKDIFTLASLTAAINEVEYKPRRLGELGIFAEQGISTTSVVVEKSGTQLGLVPAKERGAPGTVVGGDKRTGLTFTAVHLPAVATILADEVKNVRAFGTEDQEEAIQTVVNARLAKMAGRIDVTHEYQRIGAVKGQILDADGTTVLADLYNGFGITQKVVPMALNTAETNVQLKCLDVLEEIEKGLGDLFFSGALVLCGSSFWRKLISHASVKEAYLYQQSERLRADGRESFSFGGLNFERYRGHVAGKAFVEPAEAYAIPMGTDDMFITRFAPADYMSAVNTLGLPMYSSSELLKHGKGIELEGQSNPIHLNTRPQAVIKLKEGAS
ncbi:major capsid protein [Cobetia amphilecti]|uniref:major capsid protein n=1 Tax=Cobetia amphilecti TaxID=1055104 RepID=UPI001CDAF605|nr:major capsid protein [Cobetia amphilecti]UBU49805.1 major capsid protein [Cobetia amphilecti]